MTALLVSPVTAQRDKIGDIECTKLTVVDAAGKHSVIIDGIEHGGAVVAYGKDGKLGASFSIGSFGGVVEVRSRFGNATAVLGTDPHGGRVSAWDKDAKLRAILGTHEHGGIIGVMGKEQKYAELGIEEHGGYVAAMGKEKGGSAGLGIARNGNRYVSIYDRHGKLKAVMGTDKFDNGAVSTWDKNGYRQ